MKYVLLAVALTLPLAACSKKEPAKAPPPAAESPGLPNPAASGPPPNTVDHARDAVNKIQIPQPTFEDPPK
jgi:hypothetical protein